MEKEHRITYKAGITRSPSDFLCDNGELSECINLTTDNEELKVMIPPKPLEMKLDSGDRLLFVHKVGNMSMYIYTVNNDDAYCRYYIGEKMYETTLFDSGDYPIGDILQVSAIGKTLIFNTDSGILYAVWKPIGGDIYGYKILSDIPTPKPVFYTTYYGSGGDNYITTSYASTGSAIKNQKEIDDQQKYNDYIIGLYAELKNKVHQKKAFLNPFLARVALQLYDGTYTKITNPVLLFPAVSRNCALVYVAGQARLFAKPANLYVRVDTDYQDYADIVKDVVLFLSPEVDICDTSVDQPLVNIGENRLKFDGLRNGLFMRDNTISGIVYQGIFDPLAHRDPAEIKDDIIASSVFYRTASLGIAGISYSSIASLVSAHTLENLTTQEQLPNDDYYAHAPFSADLSYTYNSRLNLFGIHRGFFEGFQHFLYYLTNDDQGTNPEYQYEIFVTINTDSGERIVRKTVKTRERMGIYFFYPDPRATLARIYCYTDNAGNPIASPRLIHTLTLTEHPGLNGAYFFKGVPTNVTYRPVSNTQTLPQEKKGYEYLPNEVATSVVNNPFVFNAEGYNAVSNGRVLGVATQTAALSQGQFGQYPLVLFTTEGIWAMQVNSEGLYSSITPISRDVVTNTNAIIETDGAVFFPSDKGLMMIVGANVTCVSAKMNGSPDIDGDWMVRTNITDNTSSLFRMISAAASDKGITTFLSDPACHAAYDYRNSRLLFVRYDKDYALVYDILARAFSKLYNDTHNYTYAVRNYPDYILGNSSGMLYSLLDVGDESLLTSQTRQGLIITRPVKFSGPVGVDSIREFKNVGKWNSKINNAPSTVQTMLFYSDDLYHWTRAESRFGIAAKYWRWAIIVNLRTNERLSGTIIRTQPRRTDNTR